MKSQIYSKSEKWNLKFQILAYLLLLCAAYGLANGSDADTAEPNNSVQAPTDHVVVTVNGVDIMESQVEALVKPQLDKIAAKSAQLSPEFLEQYKKQLRKTVLDRLIIEQLLDEKIKEAGIKVTDEEVIKQIEEIASAQTPPLSLDEFKKLIKTFGQSFEWVKQQVRRGLQFEKLLSIQFVDKLKVTEEDAKKYYSENKSKFETPEQVRASHILIRPKITDPNTDPNQTRAEARAKAAELLQKIRNGADFAELAKANSDCPSAARGGDLDFFSRGEMVPAFEKVAFQLKVGQVSDIVETRYGYHIIKVTDHKDAGVIPFEQAKEDIIKQLRQEKQNGLVRQYIQSLKDQATIVYSEQ